MRAGFICSAGGAPVFAALELLETRQLAAPEDFFLLSDRQCGAIEKADACGMPHRIIPYGDCESFSAEAARLLAPYEACILLYSRRVCRELYAQLPTWNIHPSLLPEFPGLSAVEKAFECGASQLGATLHLATGTLDAGPILAHTSDPVNPAYGIEYFRKISFLQKTWLILLILELLGEKAIQTDPQRAVFSLSQSRNPISAERLFNPDLQKDFLEYRRHELTPYTR